VVPDERAEIAAALREIAQGDERLAIFTTGGTGVTPRDITPEATRDVIEREIPGFGELMRAKGRESTPYAALSRAIAGTLGGVLIINLPGSPRGAVESLGVILELVPHVLDLVNGRTTH
jgi:molybdenum cofactor synthesis domain-containing protein